MHPNIAVACGKYFQFFVVIHANLDLHSPVIMNGDGSDPLASNAGKDRLSGMIPFLACYISSVPTRNLLLLGEDRNDVVGAHKTPGQRKWDISNSHALPEDYNEWHNYDNPRITYSHRRGQMIDQDLSENFTSRLSIITGPGAETIYLTRDPGNRLAGSGI